MSHRSVSTCAEAGWGLLVLAACLLALPAPAGQAEQPAQVVEMDSTLVYNPEEITVQVGDTVRWINTSPLVHSATADPEKAVKDDSVRLPEGAETFDSGIMTQGDTFEHTFTVPGEYVYFCIPHEADGMIGRITVKE